MSVDYSPQEIVRIAIEVENSGATFYERMVKKVDSEAMKKVLCYLQDQEIVHAKNFQDLLASIDKEGIADGYGDEVYQKYVVALARQYGFTPRLVEQKLEEGFSSDRAIIEFALEMEKNAILIYSAMKTCIKNGRTAILDAIIAEEQQHVVLLTDLLSQL